MDELGKPQQHHLEVHNCGERIERAIWEMVRQGEPKEGKPFTNPYPFGMCTADSCCENPVPFMYCAFTYLMGKGSSTAAENLQEFDGAYGRYLGFSLADLFSEGEGFTEELIDDFRKLCR